MRENTNSGYGSYEFTFPKSLKQNGEREIMGSDSF